MRSARTALSAVTRYLRCPNCQASLTHGDRALRCETGHSFDISREGAVALLPPRGKVFRGDTAAMVAARESFLATGHYAPITQAIATAAQVVLGEGVDGQRVLVDLGAGTAHHLAAMLRALPGSLGIALDASGPALRRAVRADPRVAAIACDVWHELPLRDGTADLLLSVFAPRNRLEIPRVLSAGGALILATPTPLHLQQVVARLGMLRVPADKRSRLHDELSADFSVVSSHHLEFEMALGEAEIQALVAMGPSAHHLKPSDVEERFAERPAGPMTVTASVVIDTFRRSTG